MAELRALAEEIGWRNPQTYVASGNLLFDANEATHMLEEKLEGGIKARFGLTIDVIVRTADQWRAYRAGNPFPEASEREAKLVMLCLGKRPALDEDVALLRARASENERAERVGDALWLHFGDGAGRSKMSLGPKSGSWTTRNWLTVCKLAELTAQEPS